ncbi:MAG: hypothetical protein A3I29_01035 [Candidatus Magasanikbacteria bacterium RIFCSPLOWO2_02_FULL_44_11]|uniref:Uncharacterized protein n=1 Tax=Candidatus Magasanikbacteria bacterium RIFCSPLOWO2_02_FULL_44_11 TaxID=1798689 RepID=A0A1F6NAF2_9BACT|nr:MAG: hypothetical protein A3I29_01035 [Candidatus Magasanikbacteria bacterium RIFCSPLOWO2_02_FULL_44_11]
MISQIFFVVFGHYPAIKRIIKYFMNFAFMVFVACPTSKTLLKKYIGNFSNAFVALFIEFKYFLDIFCSFFILHNTAFAVIQISERG